MKRLLSRVQLRNQRVVYRSHDGFTVVQIDRHGTEHAQFIPESVVEYLAERLRGDDVSVEDAFDLLQPVASQLDLPYTHSHKLHYYAQEALVALVAAGRASLEKRGRRFVYRMKR